MDIREEKTMNELINRNISVESVSWRSEANLWASFSQILSLKFNLSTFHFKMDIREEKTMNELLNRNISVEKILSLEFNLSIFSVECREEK